MAIDLLNNGVANGSVANRLLHADGDVGVLRPYIEEDGQSYVSVNNGQDVIPTQNAATLRKDEWVNFDRVIIRAARQRLRAYADLRAANVYGGFDGFASLVLEHERMSDPGEAYMDFDGLTEGRADAPRFELMGLPLPIIHSNFYFSSRRLAMSRKLGTPIDSVMAEAAGRRVAEEIEKLTIGTVTAPETSVKSSGDYTDMGVYGYTNFPDRITKTDITAPTAGGWTPAVAVLEILDMIDSLNAAGFYGPFMCYHSTDWSQYMDIDYSTEKGDNTLRERIGRIDQISGPPRRLDFLTNTFTLLLVQMTPDVARAVNGLDFTTIQWEDKGGFRINFKVIAIQVPQLRSDINGNTGIAHGTTA